MNSCGREDQEFVECASDLELARKKLDYLIGKRRFIEICFCVFSMIAVACYIGWRFIATDVADIEGTRLGTVLFGAFAAICLGFGGSTDAYIKALILHVHREDGLSTPEKPDRTEQ